LHIVGAMLRGVKWAKDVGSRLTSLTRTHRACHASRVSVLCAIGPNNCRIACRRFRQSLFGYILTFEVVYCIRLMTIE